MIVKDYNQTTRFQSRYLKPTIMVYAVFKLTCLSLLSRFITNEGIIYVCSVSIDVEGYFTPRVKE